MSAPVLLIVFTRSRRLASVIYLSALTATLLSVFVYKNMLFALICILLQAAALSWYVLSYVPFGHAGARKILSKLLVKMGLLPKKGSATNSMPASEEV